MSADADSRLVVPFVAGGAPPPASDNAADAVTGPASPGDAVPATPQTPGARLRAAREARGLGPQQVVDALHIEPRLLDALEADRYEVFDAPVYARGFLRKYGAFLGLAAEDLLAGYDALHAGPAAPTMVPGTTSAEAPPRDWGFYRRAALGCLALALVAGSYWWWLTRPPIAVEASTERAGAGAAPVPGAPSEPADAVATEESTDRGAAADLPEAPVAGPAAAAAAVPAPGPVSVPASGAPAAAAVPLQLTFTGDCWVEVYAADGTRLAYDLFPRGASRTLPGPGPWRVFLGDVDAARLTVAGRPVVVPPDVRKRETARFEVGADGTVR